MPDRIVIRGASEHNLERVDVELPRDAITVVTGVSGSGKSSLAFDTVCREGQRRYLESFSSYARQFLAPLARPAVHHIDGLPPALAIGQGGAPTSPRSTVGTLTELYDHLRLLFARLGEAPPDLGVPLERRLFSFNTPHGACPSCGGLGVEDRVDPALLVADPARTLRQGALVPTTPTGYIVYSQVTVDVLDQVCRAHGFGVDVPWRDLTEEQRAVVLQGSDRVRVPTGKHPLESRLRWTGITARPREEGTYRGLLPVMTDVLRRTRNRNILRFVRSLPCAACGGTRLRPEARRVRLRGQAISDLAALDVAALARHLRALALTAAEAPVGEPIRRQLLARADLLVRLGLGHLPLDREASTLSSGEARRLRLACQTGTGLRGILYVLDEPTIGLHPRDTGRLLELLDELKRGGNTLVVVEHDEDALCAADWVVDLGPGAGRAGGRLLYAGPRAPFLASPPPESVTAAYATGRAPAGPPGAPAGALAAGDGGDAPAGDVAGDRGELVVNGVTRRNLRDLEVRFLRGALNAIAGVSGAGKTSLLEEIALRHEAGALAGVDRVVRVDASPIGRTPRSNPATYAGVSDAIRDLFAARPEARARGLGKSAFSFNVKGGRCEACEGAGAVRVGMRFLGDVDLPCAACGGRRFHEETLAVRWRGHTIADVLELPIAEALARFRDEPRVARVLETLVALGLGYLALGQPATTLSGGEAQRIKLGAELARPSSGHTVYLLDEPTTGLHAADVRVLLAALAGLAARGHTVLVVEHQLDVLRAAARVIDLGPEGGPGGGTIVVAGPPAAVVACGRSATGAALARDAERRAAAARSSPAPAAACPGAATAPRLAPPVDLELRGVTTHNLAGVDVAIPARRLTVVTGVSGSGKSSLVFDTLYAECQRRFAGALSTYVRRLLDQPGEAELTGCAGLTPAVAVRQKARSRNPRSTVATMTGLDDALRLIWARAGAPGDPPPPRPVTASTFSPNHAQGACPRCAGLGIVTRCDPDRLITDPSRPLAGGALAGHKPGRLYGDPAGQHMAILAQVGVEHGVAFGRPWADLDERARRLALDGTGDRRYEVVWRHGRERQGGAHRMTATWDGLLAYVEREWERKHADRRADALRPLLADAACPACGGARLKPGVLATRFGGLGLGELLARSVEDALAWLDGLEAPGGALDERARRLTADPRARVARRLHHLRDAGLGHLALGRGACTLSSGEAQRARLAAQLGAGLAGITYVLDEPTVGLHARDTGRLVALLRALRDEGNTVVVAEHDAQVIRAADHVIDLGPGAGAVGGRVVFAGPPAALEACAGSRTGVELARCRSAGAAAPATGRRRLGPGLAIRGAALHNLRALDVDLPAGGLVAVTGVSGSGKSTLVFDVLAASAAAGRPVGCASIDGLARFAAVEVVDAAPLAAAATSCPATLVGVLDPLRDRFAASPEARARGWRRDRFALGRPGGRCEACEGLGRVKVSMDFLPDVWTRCADCGGRRYQTETLACRVEGRSIADVLELTVAEAATVFAADGAIAPPLAALERIGLGYLRLGQAATALSGGEGQRLKLALGLGAGPGPGAAEPGRLLLLDEPTVGLHLEDVTRLLGVLNELVDAGHTVVVVEHNLEVVAAADWVIDLGPEGGDAGGLLVAAGPPGALAGVPGSATGAALRAAIGGITAGGRAAGVAAPGDGR